MANLQTNPVVNITITLKLEEEEARALKALTEYGEDRFIEIFYAHLGKYALEPHEAGLRSLFQSVNAILPKLLKQADQARGIFTT